MRRNTAASWVRKRRVVRSFVPLFGFGLVAKTMFTPSVQPEPAALEDLPIVDRDAAAERLAAGVRFRTVSAELDDPAVRKAFDDFIVFLERSYPLAFSRLAVERIGSHGLLLTWHGEEAAQRDSSAQRDPILLMAHYDVVPPDPDGEAWTHEPFGGDIADGYIWGRGTLDDKIGVLGLLEATEHLLASGFEPNRTIYLAFGHDEEVGGSDGAVRIAAHLAEQGVRLDYVLDEGGVVAHDSVAGVDAPVAVVGIAEKGYATAELTVEGQGGHSSLPPRHTSIGVLAAALERLENNPLDPHLHAPLRRTLETLAPESSFAHRLGLANLWLLEPIILRVMTSQETTDAVVRTTAAVTMFDGGIKDNVLPSAARATVNFRIAPGETIQDVVEHVHDVVDDDDVKVRIIDDAREPSRTSSDRSEAFKAIGSVARGVFPGAVVAPYLVLAGTDSRHFEPLAKDVYRFLPVALAPDERHRIHGADERVAVDSYASAITFYMGLMQETASDR